jgi:hypothetical protein
MLLLAAQELHADNGYCKIRNPKHEIPNRSEIQIDNVPNPGIAG